MDVGDIPLMSMLKDRMAWLGRRQNVLSQNVASADMPGYKARDLKPVDFEQALRATTRSSVDSLLVTNPRHIGAIRASSGFVEEDRADTESTPTGNSVSLESEMIKVAQTQAQFQAAANLYAKAIAMMKTAIGRGGM